MKLDATGTTLYKAPSSARGSAQIVKLDSPCPFVITSRRDVCLRSLECLRSLPYLLSRSLDLELRLWLLLPLHAAG
eukprot:5483927-Amphidinium_carterae.2